MEIILVDNASHDGSVELVERNFPDVRIIRNKSNLGFAEGNNIGIKNSNGEIICLFNPDAVADKDWLSNLVPVLMSSNKIGAVSGKIFYLGDEHGKNAVFCTWPKIDAYTSMTYNFHNDEPYSRVDYLSGAAMIVKKEVIEKVGLLDTKYFLYWEETDWCARMIRSSYDLIYTPRAIAWHAVSATISDSRKIYYMERSRIRFVLKNFDSLYIPIFSLFFLGETIFVILRDVKNGNFARTAIRIRAILWNLINITKTLKRRKIDMSLLRKGKTFRSYNKSLPLKDIKSDKC